MLRTPSLPGTPPAQNGLVLIHSVVKPGASRAPALTELASSPGDRPASRPAQRRPAAAAAAVTAATASATAEPAGGSGGGSASSAHNHTVNTPRISSAREANRASQSRTAGSVKRRHSALAAPPVCPGRPIFHKPGSAGPTLL